MNTSFRDRPARCGAPAGGERVRGHKAWTRTIAAALALVTGFTLTAAPAAAGEAAVAGNAAVAAKPSLSASAVKAAEKAPRTALAQAPQAAPADAGSDRGFFGSTKGKLAVAVFAGALGWAIYSNSDGREPVKSPVR
jgi:hypothetical protein